MVRHMGWWHSLTMLWGMAHGHAKDERATNTDSKTWVWGRGSSDCKSNVIGILSALEHLLSSGFRPSRTLLIAFGQDEEAHGYFGATRIAKVLEERYGRHGVAAIVDEGGGGLDSKYGPLIALPALAEKGRFEPLEGSWSVR